MKAQLITNVNSKLNLMEAEEQQDHAYEERSYWYKTLINKSFQKLPSRIRRKRTVWRLSLLLARLMKRFIDLTGSGTGLLLFSPVFLCTTILIKLEDRGPILFKQKRVGKNGRLFPMYKFRSMRIDADKIKDSLMEQNQHENGITFKIKKDPRITATGRWIRKLSIDELPQLYNVWRGDMSLVGPRPPVMLEVCKYKSWQLNRLRVKPGITCIWQVSGRGDIDFEDQVRLDLKYIRSESILEDIKLLLKTIPAVITGRGAY